jgi:hypothetical protein
MRIRFNSVDGFNALLTSNGWGKAGLYVKDGILQLLPSGANMWCEDDKLDKNRWYYLGMTRDDAGKITLFVDGYPCASADIPFLDHFALSPMSVTLLRDEVCIHMLVYVLNTYIHTQTHTCISPHIH